MRWVPLAFLLVSSTARADWNYRVGDEGKCPSVVVGRCGDFASGWQPIMLRLELGSVSHRTSIDPMVGTDEEGNSTGRLLVGDDLSSRGMGGRIVMGFRGYYLATDVAGSVIDEGPAVHPVANAAVAPAIVQPGNASSGWIFAMRMGLGKELRFGRLMVGAELGFGVDIVTLNGTSRDYVADPRLALTSRGHAGVWLTRHLSVSAYASTDLVRDGDRTFGLALGVALFPWDGIPSH